MEQRDSIKNRCFQTAAILLLLVLLSFWPLSGLLARYTTADMRQDFARVGSFSVSAVGDKDKLAVDCGGTEPFAEYVITVENSSETAVSYDVVLTLDSVLPEGVTVTLDGKEPTKSADGKELTFLNVGVLDAAGADAKILKFTAGVWDFTPSIGDHQYMSEMGMQVHVNFVQID